MYMLEVLGLTPDMELGRYKVVDREEIGDFDAESMAFLYPNIRTANIISIKTGKLAGIIQNKKLIDYRGTFIHKLYHKNQSKKK